MVDETKRKSIERKIEHLLRIAERATGPEAETAMLHARRLMAEWDVSEADLHSEPGYVRRTVWTGKARPVWYDFVGYLVNEFFYARGIVSSRWQLNDPAGPIDGPGKWLHSRDLFASEVNIGVACYAWTVFRREFLDQLKRNKPKSQRAFCVGVARVIRNKLLADQRGWAATSEGRELARSPRALHDKLDEAFARHFPDIESEAERRKASVGDYHAQLAGERGAAGFEFLRPLPGNEPATLPLPGQSR